MKIILKQALWSRFNIAAISILTLLFASSSSALALEFNRPGPTQEVSDNQHANQQTTCSESDVEDLTARWRESYLPAGADLRDCGDSAIAALTAIINDSTVQLRTRRLTARLMGQIGSTSAVHSLFAAVGNNLAEESRNQLQSIGLKGIETIADERDWYSEDSFNNTMLPEILGSQALPTAVRLGAMAFVARYVAKHEPKVVSHFFVETNRTLSAVVADEAESLTVRLNAVNTLSELLYHVSGEFLVEASILDQLVSVAESDSDVAIRRGAVNALMMTYYMVETDSSCEWRWEEIAIAYKAVSDLASRPNIDSLWDLGPASLSRLERLRIDPSALLKNRVALNKLIDLPHPAGKDLCDNLVEDDIAPGDFFIRHIESKNQPRLYALLVAWARSL